MWKSEGREGNGQYWRKWAEISLGVHVGQWFGLRNGLESRSLGHWGLSPHSICGLGSL